MTAERDFWELNRERFRARDRVNAAITDAWREDWGRDRRYLVFLVEVGAQPEVVAWAQKVQDAIVGPAVPAIQARWLHLTLQSVGFADEIPTISLDSLVDEARAALEDCAAFDARVCGAGSFADAAILEIEPWNELRALFDRLHEGVSALAPLREGLDLSASEGGFAPHISLAYYTAQVPAGPIAEALEPFQGADGPAVRVGEVNLVSVPPPNTTGFKWDLLARFALVGEVSPRSQPA